jgi:hypothetical protein
MTERDAGIYREVELPFAALLSSEAQQFAELRNFTSPTSTGLGVNRRTAAECQTASLPHSINALGVVNRRILPVVRLRRRHGFLAHFATIRGKATSKP